MPIKSTLAALAVSIVMLLIVAPGAATAREIPIRYCGSWGDHGAHVGWGMGDVFGAGIFNVTARRVSCRRARRFVRGYRSTRSYDPAWRCRDIHRFVYTDIRCTASRRRVVHWQTGA